MLSGGERNRLHLALALKEEGNVLLLDEPTNDIDVNTLRALEEGPRELSPAAPSSSPTTAGSWTVSPRTSSRSRATRRWSFTKAPTRVRGVEARPGRGYDAPPREVQETDGIKDIRRSGAN